MGQDIRIGSKDLSRNIHVCSLTICISATGAEVQEVM